MKRSTALPSLLAAISIGFLMTVDWAAAQEPAAPKLATMPASQPFVPEGEYPVHSRYPMFLYMAAVPGAGVSWDWDKGTIWHYGTTQSVGDGAGMYVYAPAGKVGWLSARDTLSGVVNDYDAQLNDVKRKVDLTNDYKGLCVWIKGDGSDNKAVFSVGFPPSRAHQFRIPLKDTQWHKVFMPWDKWEKPLNVPQWFNVMMSIERNDDTKANWYVIDRLHFYKDEKTEAIKPTPDQDAPAIISAKQFVSGRENIAKTLAKLKAKQPVTIVIAGDSLPWGAQLGYMRKNSDGPEHEMRQFTYWWLLAARLKEFYGYESVAINFKSFDHAKKTWFEISERDKRAKADLTVTAAVVGGWEVGHGIENLDKITEEKPDLVIWEYAANDSYNSHFAPVNGLAFPGYVKQMTPAIEKLQAAGAEVVLHTITPSADVVLPWVGVGERKGLNLVAANMLNSETIRAFAAEKKLAVADMDRGLRARGVLYLGDLYVDAVHLNHMGHEMMADILDALLTDRDVKIWRYGPVADRQRAAASQKAAPASPVK